jgi:hypothetical protein
MEQENFKHLYQTLINYGNSCTEKGKSFEFFVLNELLNVNFQNVKMIDLPFIGNSLRKLSNIPSWIKDQAFTCKNVRLSKSVNDDLDFLESKEKSVILMSSNYMGPDGIMIIDKTLLLIGLNTPWKSLTKPTNKNLRKCEVQNFYSQRNSFSNHLVAYNRFQTLCENISQKLVLL